MAKKTANKGPETFRCSQCGRDMPGSQLCRVDGKSICAACMYDGRGPFMIYPIGEVKSALERKKTGFGTSGRRGLSRIELFASQKPFMLRLEDEEFITVVYYLHEAREVKSVFKRGYDGKKVGVFASRTPDRLSRIAITDVKVVNVEGTVLHVEGLDAVDGTPVLDIKMQWGKGRAHAGR